MRPERLRGARPDACPRLGSQHGAGIAGGADGAVRDQWEPPWPALGLKGKPEHRPRLLSVGSPLRGIRQVPTVGLLRSIADPQCSLQICFPLVHHVPDEALLKQPHRQLQCSQLLGRTPESRKRILHTCAVQTLFLGLQHQTAAQSVQGGIIAMRKVILHASGSQSSGPSRASGGLSWAGP